MRQYSEKVIECPHCGHHMRVALDYSNGNQSFYDDCPACCNAVHLNIEVDELHGSVKLFVDADDEQVF